MTGWISRGAIALATLALTVLTTTATIGAVVRGNALALAIANGWGNARVYEQQADTLYWTHVQNPPWAMIVVLARRALRESPLSPRALSLIGAGREAAGDHAGALKAMQASLAVSRRDFVAHLWFINRAARLNDLDGALRHYDLALRTQEQSSTILFPSLAKAMMAPEIQRAFATTIRTRPPWLPTAMIYLAGNVADPRDLVSAIEQAGGLPSGDDYRTAESILLGQVAQRSGLAAARQFYLATPRGDRTVPTGVDFTPQSTDPRGVPLTWQVETSGDVGAAFVHGGQAAGLTLAGTAAPRTSGTLAHKLLFLSPGSYRLTAQAALDGPRDAAVHAAISCADENNITGEIWRGRLGDHAPDQPIVIPTGCTIQRIDLILSAGAGDESVEASVTALKMVPRRQTAVPNAAAVDWETRR